MQYTNGHLLDAVNNTFADATPGLSTVAHDPSMCAYVTVVEVSVVDPAAVVAG